MNEDAQTVLRGSIYDSRIRFFDSNFGMVIGVTNFV